MFKFLHENAGEINDDGVNRKHDDVLDDSGRENSRKAFSIQHGNPKGIEQTVYNDLCQKLGNKNTPKFYWFPIKNRTIDDTGKHGIKGKTKEERTGWFDDKFQNIKGTAKDTANDRTKEKFYNTVWNSGKSDSDVRSYIDGSNIA